MVLALALIHLGLQSENRRPCSSEESGWSTRLRYFVVFNVLRVYLQRYRRSSWFKLFVYIIICPYVKRLLFTLWWFCLLLTWWDRIWDRLESVKRSVFLSHNIGSCVVEMVDRQTIRFVKAYICIIGKMKIWRIHHFWANFHIVWSKW